MHVALGFRYRRLDLASSLAVHNVEPLNQSGVDDRYIRHLQVPHAGRFPFVGGPRLVEDVVKPLQQVSPVIFGVVVNILLAVERDGCSGSSVLTVELDGLFADFTTFRLTHVDDDSAETPFLSQDVGLSGRCQTG